MCQRALTRKQTLGGGGALEIGDLCLLQNGSERGGALISNLIISETVSEGWRGDAVREQACQRALTRKQTLWGGGALQIGDLRLVEDGSQRSGALGFDAVAFETASEG